MARMNLRAKAEVPRFVIVGLCGSEKMRQKVQFHRGIAGKEYPNLITRTFEMDASGEVIPSRRCLFTARALMVANRPRTPRVRICAQLIDTSTVNFRRLVKRVTQQEVF